MSKEDMIEVERTAIEALPHTLFQVTLDARQMVPAHLSGKLRVRHIRIVTGDRVQVELFPYDLTRGRSTFRFGHEAA